MNEIKEKIISLLQSTYRVPEKFFEYLEEIGFWTMPCSGGNHLAIEGGLAEHSLNVYNRMNEIAFAWVGASDLASYSSSIIITSLLHDLGKCGQFGKPGYVPNILKSGKASKSKPFAVNKELMNIPHEIRSIQMLSSFVELTEEENFAILYHNGLYTGLKYELQGHETPLYMMLHFADLWCSRVDEKQDDGDGEE